MYRSLRQTSRPLTILVLLVITSKACSLYESPTQAPPITQVIQVTQVVPVTQPPAQVTQIIPVTQVAPVTQIIPVTQIVPPINRSVQATFLGQDGGSYAGQLCETGTTNDNVHIHLAGLKTDSQPIGYSIQDRVGGGAWATPCNSVSNWLLSAISSSAGQVDLYFKPFRNAPDSTEYVITIQYGDGSKESVSVIGSRVTVVLSATFLGQDGGSFAGRLCTTGTANDNVHIHLNGLRTDKPVSIRVDDRVAGGVWATPCDPVSNWQLYFISNASNQADIYFKPFRDAPDNTEYTVAVRYGDGWTQTTSVIGWHVKP